MHHDPSLYLKASGWFHVLAIANCVALNIRLQVALLNADFNSFGYISRSGKIGSYDKSILNFLRTLHTDFQSGSAKWHSHQQWVELPFSTCPHQQVQFRDFYMWTILTGVRWNLIVVFISIFLIVKEPEHFFSCGCNFLYICCQYSVQELENGY